MYNEDPKKDEELIVFFFKILVKEDIGVYDAFAGLAVKALVFKC